MCIYINISILNELVTIEEKSINNSFIILLNIQFAKIYTSLYFYIVNAHGTFFIDGIVSQIKTVK